MKVYKPQYFLLPDGSCRSDLVLILGESGIFRIAEQTAFSSGKEWINLPGVIIPGLVNAHTHLELSPFKGSIAENTGIAGFILELQRIRRQTSINHATAISNALNEMKADGIIAVGDIDNGAAWMTEKESSGIRFHHFFETLGVSASAAPGIFTSALQKAHAFGPDIQNRISITPHAPYSCSRRLIEQCLYGSFNDNKPLSVHLLESEEELAFMQKRSGKLAEMLIQFGISPDTFDREASDSVDHVLPRANRKGPLIFVHNTLLNTEHQIERLLPYRNQIFICLCTRANQFIEKRLPDIELFIRKGFNICLGTDSLASNYSLSIRDEMNFIRQNFPSVPELEIIRWASVNGLRALGLNLSDFEPEHLWYHVSSDERGFQVEKIGN
jgi:cytosine/adenosine deaminase-related metal-dependent hydrolase